MSEVNPIEAVARALAYAEYCQSDSGVMPDWSDYRDHARAALTSLSENITVEMVEAGAAAGQWHETLWDDPKAVQNEAGSVFRAMLNHAMK